MIANNLPAVYRVLMVTDTDGGVWTYTLELARALHDYDIEVILATMGAPLTPLQKTVLEQLDNVRPYESDFKLEWMDQPWQDVKAAGEWLLELEALTQPDLVHLNEYTHAVLPWRSPTLVVGHACVYSWFAAVKSTEPPIAWKQYRQEVTRGLRSADLVTAPSKAMLGALRHNYGCFNSADPIYHGCRVEDFQQAAEKEPFIFSTGRWWDEARNVAALQHVAPRVEWPVRLAGDEQHPDASQVCPGNVAWLGQLTPPEVAEQMSRAGIYVLPARYEPSGLCALQAALAGCALVLGDIPSLREMWHDAACFVPPDDHTALAATLNELIADGDYRARIAEQVHARALRFTPHRMAKGYLAVYRRLLRREWEAVHGRPQRPVERGWSHAVHAVAARGE